jgi:hypothetical protein
MISSCCQIECKEILLTGSKHYGQYVCGECDKFCGYMPKPQSAKRPSISNYSLEEIVKHRGYEEVFCFCCGKKQKELGIGQCFERDHIVEVQEIGYDRADRLDNLQVLCSTCHAMKTELRRIVIQLREKVVPEKTNHAVYSETIARISFMDIGAKEFEGISKILAEAFGI